MSKDASDRRLILTLRQLRDLLRGLIPGYRQRQNLPGMVECQTMPNQTARTGPDQVNIPIDLRKAQKTGAVFALNACFRG